MLVVVESDTSRMSNIRQGNLRYVQIRPTKQQCDNYEESVFIIPVHATSHSAFILKSV
jgi:hypothetical protein